MHRHNGSIYKVLLILFVAAIQRCWASRGWVQQWWFPHFILYYNTKFMSVFDFVYFIIPKPLTLWLFRGSNAVPDTSVVGYFTAPSIH